MLKVGKIFTALGRAVKRTSKTGTEAVQLAEKTTPRVLEREPNADTFANVTSWVSPEGRTYPPLTREQLARKLQNLSSYYASVHHTNMGEYRSFCTKAGVDDLVDYYYNLAKQVRSGQQITIPDSCFPKY